MHKICCLCISFSLYIHYVLIHLLTYIYTHRILYHRFRASVSHVQLVPDNHMQHQPLLQRAIIGRYIKVASVYARISVLVYL